MHNASNVGMSKSDGKIVNFLRVSLPKQRDGLCWVIKFIRSNRQCVVGQPLLMCIRSQTLDMATIGCSG